MIRSMRLATAGAVVAVVLGFSLASADTEPGPSIPPPQSPVRCAPAELSATPTVALVSTELGAGRSALYFVDPAAGSDTLGSAKQPLTPIRHLPEGNVRAEVVPGTRTVLASAPVTPGRDVSFNAALFAIRPGEGAEQLCTGVVHASRPLVTPSGRVFVSRGSAGPPPADPGHYRSDELTVDEVELGSGSVYSLHRFTGYVAFLAGWHAPEVLLYRVGPVKADVVAVHADTGAVRPLLKELPPFARDFSVDTERGVLVYRGRHETDTRRWVVDEVDLASGATRRLYEGASFALAPHVWPDGGVAVNPGRRGLHLLGSPDAVLAPLGPGVDVVRGVSQDRRFVVVQHTAARGLPVPFVVDRRQGRACVLAAPVDQRVAVAGFVELAEEVLP